MSRFLFPFMILLPVLVICCGDDDGGGDGDATSGNSCEDGVRNGDETHADCGGQVCEPCAPDSGCILDADCLSGVCLSGFCTRPACDDNVKNGGEIDIDCGGDCGLCKGGQMCEADDGCSSGVCSNGLCAESSCENSVMDVNETDVDCGGADCPACEADKKCGEATDCTSGICQGGTCVAGGCNDGVANGSETDIDCGGSCEPCNDASACQAPTDCQSANCDRNTCISCMDGFQNGDETARDCGGSCDKCAAKQGCLLDADCISNLCLENSCQNPSCGDGRTNADETDIDCGGPDCDACEATKACAASRDCASKNCESLICQAPSCDDAIINGNEVDTDCGGSCGKCGDFRGCTVAADCQSGICSASNTCTTNCDVSMGPDVGGYRGCLFKPATLSCPDIAASGTEIVIDVDDHSPFIDIGFEFQYYEAKYTKLTIQSNGAVTFIEEALPSFNASRQRTAEPFDIIAGYWDTLRPKFDDQGTADTDDDVGVEGSNIRYQTMGSAPNRMFVVRWETARKESSFNEDNDQLGVFSLVLFENSEVTTCYEDTIFRNSSGDFVDSGRSASAGLYQENSAIVMSYNEAVLTDGTEIRYTIK